MPRFAIVIAGTVDNVILADPTFADSYAASKGGSAVQSDIANPGDSYSGGVFTPAPVVAELPDAATKYLFVEGLEDSLGLTENDVDSAINGMSAGRPKRRLKAWWNGAGVFRRKGNRMNDLQALMGWSNAQVNSIFAAAVLIND